MDRKKKNNTVFYLSDSQIKALSEKDFAIKIVDIARDIFLIGYYTCQRISDLGGISNENFVIKNGHKFINVRQKKTDKLKRNSFTNLLRQGRKESYKVSFFWFFSFFKHYLNYIYKYLQDNKCLY